MRRKGRKKKVAKNDYNTQRVTEGESTTITMNIMEKRDVPELRLPGELLKIMLHVNFKAYVGRI